MRQLLIEYNDFFGNEDGTVKRITKAGFRAVSNNGGMSGWRESANQAVYVDHWGTMYAKSNVGDRVWSSEGKWVVWDGMNWVAE